VENVGKILEPVRLLIEEELANDVEHLTMKGVVYPHPFSVTKSIV
jgi:hypothetical protein